MYDKDKWIDYIRYNNVVAFKYLLDNKIIDVNIEEYDGLTPIIYALYNNIEIAKLLLLSYNDINVNHQKNKWNEGAL
jgi:ankyrin repeat protein